MEMRDKMELTWFSLIAILTIVGIMLLTNIASAFSYNEIVRNAYTFDPIENALIRVYNSTGDLLDANYSDSEGIVFFSMPYNDTYWIETSRGGYNTQGYNMSQNVSYQRFVYLTYISESVTKLVYTDLTLGDHQLCFYFDPDERLVGCYDANDTILLSENNYSIYVKTNLIDTMGQSSNFLSLIKQLLPFIISFLVIVGFIVFAITIIYMMARRYKG